MKLRKGIWRFLAEIRHISKYTMREVFLIMAKKQLRTLTLLLASCALVSILLVACARPGTVSSSNSGSASSSSSGSSSSCASGDTVKTNTNNFEQSCIALKKGGTLKVVQDQTSFHILDYGLWNGSSAAPENAPAGAPAMKNLQLNGASVSVGPFTTAGTFHIYCTVHPGMNLTVVVK
jgi:plastocyanin